MRSTSIAIDPSGPVKPGAAAFFRSGTIAGISNRHTYLARNLAEIDQVLAEAEAIAVDPKDDDRDGALGLLIEICSPRSMRAR